MSTGDCFLFMNHGGPCFFPFDDHVNIIYTFVCPFISPVDIIDF